jgi:predicted dehydrogenase
MTMSRRSFLATSTGALMAAGMMTRRPVFGANDRIRVCCCGVHGQGGTHVSSFSSDQGSEVVALCDVDRNVLEMRTATLTEAGKPKPKWYTDIREALADDSIDVISIAMPNHWHALATVWGCQAGKDVYVEKPMAHSFWEAQQVVKAAKKHDRIVQHGTQQRSSAERIRDMRILKEGKLIGPVVHARGYVYKNGNRMDIGKGKPGDPPDFLDYNLWLGPAVERPFMWREGGESTHEPGGLFVHYNWHWFWDFGNGESGNQGVHEMDVACWAAGKGLPVKVSSFGARYKWKDDGQTPNTQQMGFTYPDGTLLTFEVRNLGSFPEGGTEDCANSAFGTDGYWIKGKGFFDYNDQPIPIPAEYELPPSKGQYGNFLESIRNRKAGEIHGGPEEAFISCAHIHLGNIAYRLGRSLDFDTQTQTFKGDDEASQMLKVHYRDPFVVPEIV